MRRNILFFILFFFVAPTITYADLEDYNVGEIVTENIVNSSNYFQSYEIQENDHIYQRIYGKSFPTNGEVSLSQLRYLKMIYYNYDGDIVVGEMIVHKDLASDVLDIFTEIFDAQIEIASMRLVDDFYPASGDGEEADNASMAANNTSAFNYRVMTNSTQLSNHAKGMAIDINPKENPYVKQNSISSIQVEPVTEDSYSNIDLREQNTDPHVIKKDSEIYQIFQKYGFTWGGDWNNPKDYQHFEKEVNDTVSSATQKSDKKILLVAAHGNGKDCNHASATYDGVTYYENKEAREMIDAIAQELDRLDVSYEIANEIVGDAYWSSDVNQRNMARTCPNPEADSSCCGYLTSTIGTYSSKLYEHVDSVGIDKYALVFELHFNASGNPNQPGSHTTTILKENNFTKEQEENSLKLSQVVVDTIQAGTVAFHTDKSYTGMNLGTMSHFYVQRSIPVYYMETVFMDNSIQFRAYLNHKQELAKNLAKALSEIAPESKGGNSSSSRVTGGRTVDPYPNIFGRVNLDSSDEYGCNTLFFDDSGEETQLKEFLDDLFSFIRICTPVVVIILSTIEYVQALINKDDNRMKKANQKTIKRLAIGIVIFLLPSFLNLLFHLFGLYDMSTCGIGGI